MTGIAAPQGHPHRRARSGLVFFGVLVLLLAAVAVAFRASVNVGDGGGGTVAPTEAIETWFDGHRDELFPTNTDPYAGKCPASYDERFLGTICSTLLEDLGAHQIHIIGVWATDWGGDLLLERSGSAWRVVGAEAWPDLGDPTHFGPPWSPLTAIGAWWAEHGATYFDAASVVHVRDCADATPATGSEQVIVCSSLVRDQGTVRTYSSGRVNEPPRVVLEVEKAPDETWTVTSVG